MIYRVYAQRLSTAQDGQPLKEGRREPLFKARLELVGTINAPDCLIAFERAKKLTARPVLDLGR